MGGNAVWINAHSPYDFYDNDPEELKPYWLGASPSYITALPSEATVAFYGSCWSGGQNPCDHSAKVISPTLFEWKWGAWPLFQHAPGDTPYNSSSIQYYKIPISGSNLVCSSSSQTYSTLNISGASYSWSSSNISVSGSSHSVSAIASSSGVPAYINANVSSPYSGTTVQARKNLWAGAPYVDIVEPGVFCSDMSIHFLLITPLEMRVLQATIGGQLHLIFGFLALL